MDVEIQKWNASYYISPLRKWVYGHLSLCPYGVLFHDESKRPALTSNLIIRFDNFAVMKKASSTIIFGAITIVDNKGHTHWFSSFQDRSSVFSIINHFFLSSVTQPESDRVTATSEGKSTKLGTTLLKIATDSEKTLQHAATRLSEQGEQIDNSVANMHDLHSDLDVGSNVVSDLESWVGRWKIPKKYVHVDPIIVKDKDVPQVFDYEMLYMLRDSKKFHSKKDGVVRVSCDGITILNLTQKVIHLFKWSMISTIQVVSPWEMMVTQHFIGSPDLSYAVLSAHLIHVLRKIEMFPVGKRKLDYEPSAERRLLSQETAASRGQTIEVPPDQGPPPAEKSESDDDEYDDVCEDQAQITKEKPVIADQEVEQLTTTLSNLKSMALAVQHEEDAQNEKLTNLTDSVDRANDRLKATTKRTNKLL